MGNTTSIVGNGVPTPASPARRGKTCLECVEVMTEMFVMASKKKIAPDHSELSSTPAQLHHLTFAKVRSFAAASHPLDPPVLILYPVQPGPDGLMPVSERVSVFTSRTLRSVVYYRGELALELMPQPHKGSVRKRVILHLADEHVSRKAWKGHTRRISAAFRAYWEQLPAQHAYRCRPGFAAPSPDLLAHASLLHELGVALPVTSNDGGDGCERRDGGDVDSEGEGDEEEGRDGGGRGHASATHAQSPHSAPAAGFSPAIEPSMAGGDADSVALGVDDGVSSVNTNPPTTASTTAATVTTVDKGSGKTGASPTALPADDPNTQLLCGGKTLYFPRDPEKAVRMRAVLLSRDGCSSRPTTPESGHGAAPSPCPTADHKPGGSTSSIGLARPSCSTLPPVTPSRPLSSPPYMQASPHVQHGSAWSRAGGGGWGDDGLYLHGHPHIHRGGTGPRLAGGYPPTHGGGWHGYPPPPSRMAGGASSMPHQRHAHAQHPPPHGSDGGGMPHGGGAMMAGAWGCVPPGGCMPQPAPFLPSPTSWFMAGGWRDDSSPYIMSHGTGGSNSGMAMGTRMRMDAPTLGDDGGGGGVMSPLGPHPLRGGDVATPSTMGSSIPSSPASVAGLPTGGLHSSASAAPAATPIAHHGVSTMGVSALGMPAFTAPSMPKHGAHTPAMVGGMDGGMVAGYRPGTSLINSHVGGTMPRDGATMAHGFRPMAMRSLSIRTSTPVADAPSTGYAASDTMMGPSGTGMGRSPYVALDAGPDGLPWFTAAMLDPHSGSGDPIPPPGPALHQVHESAGSTGTLADLVEWVPLGIGGRDMGGASMEMGMGWRMSGRTPGDVDGGGRGAPPLLSSSLPSSMFPCARESDESSSSHGQSVRHGWHR